MNWIDENHESSEATDEDNLEDVDNTGSEDSKAEARYRQANEELGVDDMNISSDTSMEMS